MFTPIIPGRMVRPTTGTDLGTRATGVSGGLLSGIRNTLAHLGNGLFGRTFTKIPSMPVRRIGVPMPRNIGGKNIENL